MAVYTEISDRDLSEFISRYNIGEVLSCKGIAEGVENSNFLLTTSEGLYILTLYEKRVSQDDLPFFLKLMDHLATMGVPCPLPVRNKFGEALGELSGKPAAVISFLTGIWPRQIIPSHCAEVGRALAELHLAGRSFEYNRENSLGVKGWGALFKSSAHRADEIQSGLNHFLQTELLFLEENWPEGLPGGIIHADLFPDNVFFRGAHLSGMIDFYFSCTDTYAYDIAICLNAWCFEPDHGFNSIKAGQLLKNYRNVRDLSGHEIEALPILTRGSAMRFLLTRLYDWMNTPRNAMVRRKDPLEFFHKLQFHMRVNSPQDYGLDF